MLLSLLRLIPVWAWALLACTAVIAIQSWRIDAKDAELSIVQGQRAEAQVKADSLKATLKLQRELYSESVEADARASKDLNHALQANKALAGRIASGSVRLRVTGTCVPSASGAAGVGNGEVELSRDAGPAYQAHRDELIKERARVRYLIERYEELRKRFGAH